METEERVSSLLAQFDWEDATITKDNTRSEAPVWMGSPKHRNQTEKNQDRFLAIMDNEKAAEYLQEAGIDVVGR